MKISQKGIDFLKEAEGFEPKEYICPGGEKTIGYGHVLRKGTQHTPGETYPNGISKVKAETLLLKDIEACEITINKRVKVKLTQGQFDALVSLIFNWGTANFIKSEGLKKLNKGDYTGALKEFSEVTRTRGRILNGLVKRREKEAEMWNEEPKAHKWIYPTEDRWNFGKSLYKFENEGQNIPINQPNKDYPIKDPINNIKIGIKKEDEDELEKEKIKFETSSFKDLIQKYYRLAVITICFIVLSLIVFNYYNASAKPLEGEYTTCFTPPEHCGDLIVKHINGAKKTIYMQAYGFTSGKIIGSLMEAKKRGIDVQIILDRSNMSNIKLARLKVLARHGIILYQDKVSGIAHNKIIIIDEHTVITGSFNFTENADTRNAENIIIITNTEVAKDYLQNWENRNKEKIE